MSDIGQGLATRGDNTELDLTGGTLSSSAIDEKRAEESVRQLFFTFLHEHEEPSDTSTVGDPEFRKFYVKRAMDLITDTDSSTLAININHLHDFTTREEEEERRRQARTRDASRRERIGRGEMTEEEAEAEAEAEEAKIQEQGGDLYTSVVNYFYRFQSAIHSAVTDFVYSVRDRFARQNNEGETKRYFASFYGLQHDIGLRDLKTRYVGVLQALNGTVTRISEVRPELALGCFRCGGCNTIIKVPQTQLMYTEPVVCTNVLCSNRTKWQLIVEKSEFSDWQKVRIQENSSDIPAGSMPRSMDVILRNEMVEKAKAGDKCVFTGTLVVISDNPKAKAPGYRQEVVRSGIEKGAGTDGITGLKSLGAREINYRMCFLANNVEMKQGSSSWGSEDAAAILDEMDDDARQEILAMSETPGLFDKLAESLAPNVHGLDDIKKGILLMLLGGVHKTTHEGIALRGDLNICLVGDPSTAKSQFLKYVTQLVPRAIYTSGKASTSSGLTAAVTKDPESGEFMIEAGALMLADNGICCIDEFDKMDEKDQVAIHEAMEQQTISIAKAGIHATLNARTSILAAANPKEGRYDTSKSLKQNVGLSPAIMSRFDLFFVILDQPNEIGDWTIARHIVGLHSAAGMIGDFPGTDTGDGMSNTTRQSGVFEPPFTMQQLQRYMRFARSIKPAVGNAASKLLVKFYRKLRERDVTSARNSAYKVTVRQLESMIRLSEAIARIHCKEVVEADHVRMAFNLIASSIVHSDGKSIELIEDEEDEEDERENGEGESMEMTQPTTQNGEAAGTGSTRAESDDNPNGTEAEASDKNTETESEKPGEKATEEADERSADASGEKPADSEAAQRAEEGEQPKERRVVEISNEKYERLVNMIVIHIRRLVEQQQQERARRESGGAPSARESDGDVQEEEEGALYDGTYGVTRRDLLDWVLGQESIDTEEELLQERRIVTMVIRRMITLDYLHIVNAQSAPTRWDQLLVVNPNLVLQNE